jgi:hypothetical protein
MRSGLAASLLGLLSVSVLACSDKPATSIMLALRANEVASAVDHVELHVYRPSDSSLKFERCFPQGSCSAGGAGGAAGAAGSAGSPGLTSPELPGTLALYPESQDELSTPVLVVLEGKAGGVTKISRRARMSFVKEKSKLLRLELAAACLGVDCSQAATGQADQTCVDGKCDKIAVDAETQPDFSTPEEAIDPKRFKDNSAGASGSAGVAGMAGQGGAGMAGQGGAGMAGMAGAGGCAGAQGPLAVGVSTVSDTSGGMVIGAGAPFKVMITVKGGVPPYQVTLDSSQAPVGQTVSSSDGLVTLPDQIDTCVQPVQYSVKVTDACLNETTSSLSINPTASGPYVSTKCDPNEQCGSLTKPWCLVSPAIGALDASLWVPPTVKVATGSYDETSGLVMRDGVDVEGGFADTFMDAKGLQMNGDPNHPATILSSQPLPAGTLISWPDKVTAKLSKMSLQPPAATDPTTGTAAIEIADSALATLEDLGLKPVQSTLQYSAVGIRVSPSASSRGSLTLQKCDVIASDVSNSFMLSTHSAALLAQGNLDLTIESGVFTGGTVQTFGSASSLGVGVAIDGMLTVQPFSIPGTKSSPPPNLTAGVAQGGVSVGLYVAGASPIQLTEVEAFSPPLLTGLAPICADGARIGVDPLTLCALDVPVPTPGQIASLDILTGAASVFQAQAVQPHGVSRGLAVFSSTAALEVKPGKLDSLSASGANQPSFSGDTSLGLLFDLSGANSSPMQPSITLSNLGSIVGGGGAVLRAGVMVLDADVTLSSPQATIRGTDPKSPLVAGQLARGLLLRQTSARPMTAVITGGDLAGGPLDGSMNGGLVTESIGIEADIGGNLTVSGASVGGCTPPGCKGASTSDRAVAVRVLHASAAEITGSTLIGGDLDSQGAPTPAAEPTSAGVVVEPVLDSKNTPSLGVVSLSVHDNTFIRGGVAVNSYGVAVQNLLGLAPKSGMLPSLPSVAVVNNFISPGGAHYSNNVPSFCVAPMAIQMPKSPLPCKSVGMQVPATPGTQVVNNVILSGVGDFSQALNFDSAGAKDSTLIANNLMVGEGNSNTNARIKILSLEGNNINQNAMFYVANNILVPSEVSPTQTSLSLSNGFLLDISTPAMIYQPHDNEIAMTSNQTTFVLWNMSTNPQISNLVALSSTSSMLVLNSPQPVPVPTSDGLNASAKDLASLQSLAKASWYPADCTKFFAGKGTDLSKIIPQILYGQWQNSMQSDILGTARKGSITLGPLECH